MSRKRHLVSPPTLREGIEANQLESNFVPNSQLSLMIQKLLAMTRNPSIEHNLRDVLDEFLDKLGECDNYLENGLCNFSFAQAALILQNSANVYAKKVDLLWDAIFDYQKRLVISEHENGNKAEDLEKVEERKRKYKRKRKTKADEIQSEKLVHSFSFGNDGTNHLNEHYEVEEIARDWLRFKIGSSGDVVENMSNTKLSFLPNTSVFNEDGDYVGKYDQLHSTHVLELMENETIQETDDVQFKQSFVSLEPLPDDILNTKLQENSDMQDKMRRPSVADSLFNEEFVELPENTSATENRSKSCSQDSAFYEMESEADLDASAQAIDGAVTPFNDTELPTDGATETVNDVDTDTPLDATLISDLSQGDIMVFDLSKETSLLTSTPIAQPAQKESKRVVKKRVLDLSGDFGLDDEAGGPVKKTPRKKRMTRKSLISLATGITAMKKDFEDFFRLHYKPSEGEGAVPDAEEVQEEAKDEEEESEEEEEPESEPENYRQSENDDEEATELPENMTTSISPVPPENDIFTNTPLPEVHVTRTSPLPPTSLEQEEICKKNVREWRSFILPKLKNLENKADFDIHEYGSNLIGPLQIGEEKHFRDVIGKNKEPSEVARALIATLQLANTMNIEITGNIPGKIANDTFKIKVLDKTKHHELLDEYQAPSEETFKERLERVRSMKGSSKKSAKKMKT